MGLSQPQGEAEPETDIKMPGKTASAIPCPFGGYGMPRPNGGRTQKMKKHEEKRDTGYEAEKGRDFERKSKQEAEYRGRRIEGGG